jgi:O-antigen/teichoic acid export membrane protein
MECPPLSLIGQPFPVRLLRSAAFKSWAFIGRARVSSNARISVSRRSRRAALSGVTTLLSGGLKMAGSLITLPLLLHYLGAEGFGVWVALTSLMALSALGDLGIGNGLINAISAAHGTDDRTSARIWVSSAFLIALTLSCALLVVFAILDAVLSWPTVFNLPSSSTIIAEVGPAVEVMIGCVVLNVLLGVVVKVRTGYQEIHINMLWEILGIAFSIVTLVVLVWLKAALPWLVLAEVGVPLIAMGGNIACLFFVERPWLRPSLSCVRFDAMRKLLNLGLLFVVLHLVGIAAFSSDNLLAIWICGPEAAGLYAIAMRLFSPCRLLAGALLGPLWPAYGEAIARGDIAWIRRTVAASIIITEAIVLPLALVCLFFGNDLVGLWFQQPISLGFALLSGAAVWVVLETIGSGLTVFLNGASVLRAQFPLGIAFAVSAIAAKVAFANQFGIAGIIWAAVVTYSITQLVPYAHIIRRHIRELTRQSAVAGGSFRESASAPPGR